MNNGPVEATFKVIRDFLHYKTGVYQHIAVEQIQGHAFRLLGWNYDWGDAGTFKILRGSDHLGIEGWTTAGMPKLDNDPNLYNIRYIYIMVTLIMVNYFYHGLLLKKM